MILIDNYSDFDKLVTNAVTGSFNLVVLEGPGGTGKTASMRESLTKAGTDHKYFVGYTTKLQFVKDIYDSRGKLLVLDDLDTLLRDRALVGILKSLCDTIKVKTIRYASTSPQAQIIPEEFTTESKVIVIVNSMAKMTEDIKALLSRGLHIVFKPTVQQVLTRMTVFGHDKEIMTYFRKLAWQLDHFNLRAYYHAKELKNARLDWKRLIGESLETNKELITAYEVTKKYKDYATRAFQFAQLTNTTERQYDRMLVKLRANGMIKSTGRGRGRKTVLH